MQNTSKLETLKAHAAKGDWPAALRIAAKFPELGDERTAILRAHGAIGNASFYAQLGQEPAALIAEGIAALQRRYNLLTPQKDTAMNALTTEADHKVDARKPASIKRALKRAEQKNAAIVAATPAPEVKAAGAFTPAKAPTLYIVAAQREVAAVARENKGRKAALAVAEAQPPKPAKAKPAKVAKAPKADKPAKLNLKAEALAAAQRGELPQPPDFSPKSHAPFRKPLAAVVAMVEAGDIKGLKAHPMQPKSSSRVMLCRYRDLAIVALEAKAAAKQ